jgi:hypothetical protein
MNPKRPPRVPTKNHPDDEYDSDDMYDIGPGEYRDGNFTRKARVKDRNRTPGAQAPPLHGQLRLLQLNVKGLQSRLNPHVPLAEVTDCGANTLFSLEGVLTRKEAEKLSEYQNCDRKGAHYEDFTKYLFTSIRREYDIVGMDEATLLRVATNELESGKGSVFAMDRRDADGHLVQRYKDRLLGTGHYVALCKIDDKLVLIDSQTGTVTEGIEAIQSYFEKSGYNFFRLPYYNEKRGREEGGTRKRRKRKSRTKKRATKKRGVRR